jgi:hypothetical protein
VLLRVILSAPWPLSRCVYGRARAVGAASSATAMLINAKFQPRANLPTGKSIKTTAAFITETERPTARESSEPNFTRGESHPHNRRFKVTRNSTDLISEPLCQG